MSIATQLKFEEQRRKKDLENMLDVHIDSLRRSNEHANGNNNFI
jgi:DNA-binding response OmpR family regulator